MPPPERWEEEGWEEESEEAWCEDTQGDWPAEGDEGGEWEESQEWQDCAWEEAGSSSCSRARGARRSWDEHEEDEAQQPPAKKAPSDGTSRTASGAALPMVEQRLHGLDDIKPELVRLEVERVAVGRPQRPRQVRPAGVAAV